MTDGPRRPSAESEARLEELRHQAATTGRVADAGVRAAGSPLPERADAWREEQPSYYGMPVVKGPPWTWEVPLYFFVGGAAGAAAVVGAAARWSGADRSLVRDARAIAAVGATASAPLLISDLGRPERFLNMLRVFKLQSPMSVGAWTLVAFSNASAATLFAERVKERGGGLSARVIENCCEALAAVTGGVMTSYTGVLLGLTAIPVWQRRAGVLPIHFAASALGAAVGLLELRGHRQRALQGLGLAAALVESALAAADLVDDDREQAGAHARIDDGLSGWLVSAGAGLSGPLPLILRLAGMRREAAVASVLGSLLTRYGWVRAGQKGVAG